MLAGASNLLIMKFNLSEPSKLFLQYKHYSNIMRKLEKQMNQAIRGQRNWAGSNTTVFTTDNGLESTVYLHGNHIATFDHVHQNLYIFDGGWQSNTTKSRLNALCYEFNTGFKVIQRDWTWYLVNFLGTKQLFNSGMEVA